MRKLPDWHIDPPQASRLCNQSGAASDTLRVRLPLAHAGVHACTHLVRVLPNWYAKCSCQTEVRQLHRVGYAVD